MAPGGPTARPIPAQGTALGIGSHFIRGLKARFMSIDRAGFQPFDRIRSSSWGDCPRLVWVPPLADEMVRETIIRGTGGVPTVAPKSLLIDGTRPQFLRKMVRMAMQTLRISINGTRHPFHF